MIEKENPTDETVPCLRRGCPGIEPWTVHRPVPTANSCVVIGLAHMQMSIVRDCDRCEMDVSLDAVGSWVDRSGNWECPRGGAHEVEGGWA